MSPSATASSTPVTVTVCATFQSSAMNVRLDADAVPSVGSLLETGTTTSATGWLVSTTLNVATPPASVVTRPEVGTTVKPATSLSVFVTATSVGSSPEYLASVLVAAPSTTA